MSVDLIDTLGDEILLLEPYVAMHTADVVDANTHNDQIIAAYLLGKLQGENA